MSLYHVVMIPHHTTVILCLFLMHPLVFQYRIHMILYHIFVILYHILMILYRTHKNLCHASTIIHMILYHIHMILYHIPVILYHILVILGHVLAPLGLRFLPRPSTALSSLFPLLPEITYLLSITSTIFPRQGVPDCPRPPGQISHLRGDRVGEEHE